MKFITGAAVFILAFLLAGSSSFAQDYSRVEAFTFQVTPDGVSSDTVRTSVEYFDSSGKRTHITETWWNNGWYIKTQYFDTAGFMIRKTLVINDSSYYVESRYDIDNMGNVVNEYTTSSKGEDFIMAYQNAYETFQIKEAKMMFINQKKKDEAKPPRGRTTYDYDEYGRLVTKTEVFAEEKNITTRFTYYNSGLVKSETRKDNLNDKEVTIEYNYNDDKKISLSRSISGEKLTSATTYSYVNSRLDRQVTVLSDGSKQVVMYFYF